MDWEKLARELTISTSSKIVLLVLDGLGDLPAEGKTAQGKARMPTPDPPAGPLRARPPPRPYPHPREREALPPGELLPPAAAWTPGCPLPWQRTSFRGEVQRRRADRCPIRCRPA